VLWLAEAARPDAVAAARRYWNRRGHHEGARAHQAVEQRL
jgi:hypothetical protein